MITNGYRLKPISSTEARKLPEGTVLIVHRIKRDFMNWRKLEEHFYRAVIQHRRTVGGPDVAVKMEPDWEWPEIAGWPMGWIWLQEVPGMLGYMTIEGKA